MIEFSNISLLLLKLHNFTIHPECKITVSLGFKARVSKKSRWVLKLFIYLTEMLTFAFLLRTLV